MKASNNRVYLIGAVLLAMLVGVALRIFQLCRCMTDEGLIQVGNPILYIMLAFAVLALAALAVLCTKLPKQLGSDRCFRGGAGYLLFDLLGAVLVFHGSLLRIIQGDSPYLFVGGMLAAACLAVAALLGGRQSKALFWLYAVTCLFCAAMLIFDFKDWSTDPLVIDFCFRLLALVFGMLALLHLSGFALRYGRRRLAVFWASGAVVFTAMILPDLFLGKKLTLGSLLPTLGLTVFVASHALRILRAKEEAPAEDLPAPETP